MTMYYVFTHSVACSLTLLVFPHISCSFCKCHLNILVFFVLVLSTTISLSQHLFLDYPSVYSICILQCQLQLLFPNLQFLFPFLLMCSWVAAESTVMMQTYNLQPLFAVHSIPCQTVLIPFCKHVAFPYFLPAKQHANTMSKFTPSKTLLTNW